MKVLTFCSSSVSLSSFLCFWFIYKKESVNFHIFPKCPLRNFQKSERMLPLPPWLFPLIFTTQFSREQSLYVHSSLNTWHLINMREFKLFKSALTLDLSFIAKNDKFESKVMCTCTISNLIPYKTKGRHRKRKEMKIFFCNVSSHLFFFGQILCISSIIRLKKGLLWGRRRLF